MNSKGFAFLPTGTLPALESNVDATNYPMIEERPWTRDEMMSGFIPLFTLLTCSFIYFARKF
jgi:hypothetical protein